MILSRLPMKLLLRVNMIKTKPILKTSSTADRARIIEKQIALARALMAEHWAAQDRKSKLRIFNNRRTSRISWITLLRSQRRSKSEAIPMTLTSNKIPLSTTRSLTKPSIFHPLLKTRAKRAPRLTIAMSVLIKERIQFSICSCFHKDRAIWMTHESQLTKTQILCSQETHSRQGRIQQASVLNSLELSALSMVWVLK